MKKRLLFNEIIKYLDRKEAIVITGMRQVGKTTLMRQVFDYIGDKPKLWFDFENPLDVKIFEDIDYNNIYNKLSQQFADENSGKRFVFIDEIQIFPEITKIIKYLIDHYDLKFIVTGSSNYYLRNLFPESLSGRKFLFQLDPLNFQEFLYFSDKLGDKELQSEEELFRMPVNLAVHKKYEVDYEIFSNYGGFPAVVLEKKPETKKMILKNIFASFFEKDLNILSDYKDIKELRDLILLLVPRIGSTLDITRLSGELAISRQKIYDYLEFLQGTFVIKLLSRYAKGIDRSVSAGKKVYFSDTGLLNIIGSVTEGQLFENCVINQLSQKGDLSYYHKKNKAEIDAILDKKTAFEIKLTGTDKDLLKLKKLSLDLKIEKCFVISKNYTEKESFVTPVVL